MHRNRWIGAGLATIGVGAALLQVSTAEFIKPTPPYVRPSLEILGLLLITAGLCMVIWPLLPDLPEVDYLPRRAKRGDLKSIFDLCDREFDGQVSSLNKMKSWFNHNPTIFWVVERVKWKVGVKYYEMVGYFSILPLTRNAAEAIQREELPGTDFIAFHIQKPKVAPSAYYIGGVAAVGFRSRGRTLDFLKAKVLELEDASRESGSVAEFFTRPITPIGVRLMGKYDFHPVDVNVVNPLGRVHWRKDAS